MMERTLAAQTTEKIGQGVELKGWVNRRRDHGQIIFLDLRDRSGIVQLVVNEPLSSEPEVERLRPEYVIEITGMVVSRDEKTANPRLPTGKVEVKVDMIKILSAAESLPFDMGKEELDLNLPTLLDYRTLTLRHPRVAEIFKVQEAVMEGFRKASQALGCTEVFVPTVAASATEGGAEVFPVDYYGHKTYLVQSPQLYKQMMVPVFERVYLVSHAYRAEPSVTTRHLSESIQLDCELGFVTFDELLDALEFVGRETIKYVSGKCVGVLADFVVEKPKVEGKVPRVTMREAQEIVFERTGADHRLASDLDPEDEREICRWALEKHDCDFVTVTHYPTKKRSFYTMPDPEDPEFSLSYDLLFRGVEILSGSQRVNDHQMLLKTMAERTLEPKNFEMYLQSFKYGMPPEGGFSFGLERMTKQILNLDNIREASLFPRDMERVDFRFSDSPMK